MFHILQLYYKAVSYAGSEPMPLTSKNQIADVLTASGFDGEMHDYFPNNKTLKVCHSSRNTLDLALC